MKPVRIALMVIIPLLIFLFCFRVAVFNTDFYQEQFEENNVYDSFPKADMALTNLMDYFQGGIELNDKIYTEREILHLKDVRSLIMKFLFILTLLILIILVLILTLIYRKQFHGMGNAFLIGGSISLGISLLIILISAFSFTNLFDVFHRFMFSNDLWLLSDTTALIKMFPIKFFYNITKNILLNSIYLSLFMMLLGYGSKLIKD